MHPLIPIEDLAKLTDAELAYVEARLRDLVLCPSLDHADRARCAASLGNTITIRTFRMSHLRAHHSWFQDYSLIYSPYDKKL